MATTPVNNFLNLMSYEAFEAATNYTRDLEIAQEAERPRQLIKPEAIFYYLGDVHGFSSNDVPLGFEQVGNKMSLAFGGVPELTLVLAVFSMIHSNVLPVKLDGIHEVRLNAGMADERIYTNVSTCGELNQSLIPIILQDIQLLHAKY